MLQEIIDFDIINHTLLGSIIQNTSSNNIDLALGFNGCGWLDGNCLNLADGLHKAFNDLGYSTSLCVVTRMTSNQCDHIIVKLINNDNEISYFDADGEATADEMINKMEMLENPNGEKFSIIPFRNEIFNILPYSVEMSDAIHEMMLYSIEEELSNNYF